MPTVSRLTSFWRPLLLVVIALACDLVQPQPVRAASALSVELAPLAHDVAALLIDLHQDAVAIGTIRGPAQANAGPGIGQVLADELARLKVTVLPDARLTLQGSYALMPARETKTLTARIKLEAVVARKVVGSFSRDVCFKSDARFPDLDGARPLASLLAVTADLPPNENLKGRQEKFRDALERPSFHRKGARICASATSPYSVELLVGGRPRQPSDDKGLAFVEIKKDELYALRLTNDSDHEAAVTVTIDGLSLFAFSDKKLYTLVVVPPKATAVIPGWHRTNTKSEAFKVTAYPESAVAKLLPGSTAVGIITVTFAAAWPVTQPAPDDEEAAQLVLNRGEKLATGRGPEVRTGFKEVERHIGVMRAAVSVRYTRGE